MVPRTSYLVPRTSYLHQRPPPLDLRLVDRYSMGLSSSLTDRPLLTTMEALQIVALQMPSKLLTLCPGLHLNGGAAVTRIAISSGIANLPFLYYLTCLLTIKTH